MKHQQGFTLIEVLIAISLFALVGLASQHMLTSVINTRTATDVRSAELTSLQRGITLISSDIEQMIRRPVRDDYGDNLPPLLSSGGYIIEFTRHGWSNPLKRKRSHLQRVAYEIKNKQLLRHYWNVLDRTQNSQANTQIIFENIEGFSLQYLNFRKHWNNQWNDEHNLPLAIEVIIELPILGKVGKVVRVMGYKHDE